MSSTRYLTGRRIETRYEGGRQPSVVLPREQEPQKRTRARAGRRATSKWRDRTRRAVNVVAALTLIVLTAPLMLVIGVLVKATSEGPMLYTQPRVGLDRRSGRRERRRTYDGASRYASRRLVNHGGKIFRIYKFRTMTVSQEPPSEVWASPDDPRITPLGRVLRKYRLDELPQLFNVLTGEMNLVGPRPEQPRIFAELRERIDHYPVRQKVLPGITGWAQVNRAYDQTFDDVKEKVDFDLEYLNRRSALEDIRIMMRTVPVVLLKRGSM